MSTAHGTLDPPATTNLHQHAPQPLGATSGQGMTSLSSYVGLHRRPDNQNLSPDGTQRQAAYRSRHRRWA